VPLPLLDRDRLAEIDRRELARFPRVPSGQPGEGTAHNVEGPQLSVGVRTVGELFRRTGMLLADRSPDAEASLRDLRAQFRSEVRRGKVEDLLALRSLQSQLFVEALESPASEANALELRELGGDLTRLLDRGWLEWKQRDQKRLVVDAETLRLLFRVRWGHLVGCHREVPFGPSLEEFRAYYAVYLRHPPQGGEDEMAQALERIRYVTALAKIDPDYPEDFALGSFYLQAQQYELATTHLRAHLRRSEDGPLALLARSHLLFAAASP